MRSEPTQKRAVAFFDGQNLFYAAKAAFGYKYPNYDPLRLAEMVCAQSNWKLTATRFYTGIPHRKDDLPWHDFWSAKLAVLGTRGVYTFTRHLKYREQSVPVSTGGTALIRVGHEKGIDVRIALDMVRMARNEEYDVALLFSQDQDLSEAVDEVKSISTQQNRWIKIACAFPIGAERHKCRGINGTDWTRLDRNLYDACIDPNDYRSVK